MLVLTDFKGKEHKLIAARPMTSHKDDYYLMVTLKATGTNITPWVVHTMNLNDGGFSGGAYCTTLNEAMAVFNAR